MDQNEIYEKASETVDSKLDFYSHFIRFALICSVLVAFNIYRSGEITWAKWVLIGWGFGISVHWFDTFVTNKNFMQRTRDKMIKKEIRRMS